MKKYIFDVDGTLADPREPMDAQFMRWFEHWMLKKDVYLCTNNTYENILPRLGRRIIEKCAAIFTCGGNSVWIRGKEAKVSSWRPSLELLNFLEDLLKTSGFKTRSGPNIEYKTGMVSFTVVGKDATTEERKKYAAWDKQSRERSTMVEDIQKAFKDLYVCKAGDTSIDISDIGHDKSQIVQYFEPTDNILFIGNEFGKHGNDNTLVKALENKNKGSYNTIQVHSWNDTFKYLMNEK